MSKSHQLSGSLENCKKVKIQCPLGCGDWSEFYIKSLNRPVFETTDFRISGTWRTFQYSDNVSIYGVLQCPNCIKHEKNNMYGMQLYGNPNDDDTIRIIGEEWLR